MLVRLNLKTSVLTFTDKPAGSKPAGSEPSGSLDSRVPPWAVFPTRQLVVGPVKLNTPVFMSDDDLVPPHLDHDPIKTVY